MAATLMTIAGAPVQGLRLPGRKDLAKSRAASVVTRAQAEPVKPAMAPGPSSPSSSKPAGVTVEYQRQRAKEMTKYFNELKLEKEIKESQIFGWTERAEKSNGRWVMFGLLVGMLTEYATGVNFPEQVVITLANMGIVDLYD